MYKKVLPGLFTTALLISSVVFSYGQKTLSEYTLKSSLLEQIDPSSIPDIQAYQRDKFSPSRGRFTTIKLRSNEYIRLYRLKGHDDLVKFSQRLNNEFANDWDKAVQGYVATFTPTEFREYTRYEESIGSKDYKAYIFL